MVGLPAWHFFAIPCLTVNEITTCRRRWRYTSFTEYQTTYYFTMTLDPTDLRLLEVLQDDASLSNQALAERAHTSPATALRRVRRLVDEGIIERQVAIVSPDRVGEGLTAVVEVTLERQGDEHLQAFESRAVAETAVQQVYRVSPGPDFVLVVRSADMAGHRALVQRLFTQDANVRNVKAYFSVKRAKFDPRIRLTPAAG